jgi:hypothetical protein
MEDVLHVAIERVTFIGVVKYSLKPIPIVLWAESPVPPGYPTFLSCDAIPSTKYPLLEIYTNQEYGPALFIFDRLPYLMQVVRVFSRSRR